MNYTNFLIRVITKPERSYFDNDIIYTEFIGKFYQYRKNEYTFCKISVWGNLAYDTLRYYQTNDYLIIEGYLSLRDTTLEKLNIKTSLEITACKIYPFALTKINGAGLNTDIAFWNGSSWISLTNGSTGDNQWHNLDPRLVPCDSHRCTIASAAGAQVRTYRSQPFFGWCQPRPRAFFQTRRVSAPPFPDQHS